MLKILMLTGIMSNYLLYRDGRKIYNDKGQKKNPGYNNLTSKFSI